MKYKPHSYQQLATEYLQENPIVAVSLNTQAALTKAVKSRVGCLPQEVG